MRDTVLEMWTKYWQVACFCLFVLIQNRKRHEKILDFYQLGSFCGLSVFVVIKRVSENGFISFHQASSNCILWRILLKWLFMRVILQFLVFRNNAFSIFFAISLETNKKQVVPRNLHRVILKLLLTLTWLDLFTSIALTFNTGTLMTKFLQTGPLDLKLYDDVCGTGAVYLCGFTWRRSEDWNSNIM